MDDLFMMMGDDPLVYQSPPALSLPEAAAQTAGDVITNTTNQMLELGNDKKRKGNRRQNNNQRNRNRHRNNNNNNNQNDGTSFDDGNPINVISAFNRTNKIYNKLRKNDAVKVIDTPSGRAGFVYQSSSSNNQESPSGPSVKESNSNWEDSYSQNQFVNRNANDVKLVPDDTSNKKIMPVLTSDGKIALVVRGDTSRYFDESQNNGSGNSVSSKKYEPITNLTSIITALNSNNDNNVNVKQNDSISRGVGSDGQLKTIQEQNRLINRLDEFFAQVTNKVKHIEEVVEHELGIDVENTDSDDDGGDDDEEPFEPPTTTTTTTEAPFDEEDHKKNLLQINRPLSEVLGLPKKTHYHHPQDPLHTTSELPFTRSSTTEVRRINTPHKTSTQVENVLTTPQPEEFDHESPEVINIAVIPGFDSEMEERLFGKGGKDNSKGVLNNEVAGSSGAISSIHCAMQAMVAIFCACTVFGVLGAYYRVEVVNQVRVIYW